MLKIIIILKNFCCIINVFTITFDKYNAPLLNTNIIFFQNK